MIIKKLKQNTDEKVIGRTTTKHGMLIKEMGIN